MAAQGLVPQATAMLAVGQKLEDKLPAGASLEAQAPAGRALPAVRQQSAEPPPSAGVRQRSAAQHRGGGHRSLTVLTSLWGLCLVTGPFISVESVAMCGSAAPGLGCAGICLDEHLKHGTYTCMPDTQL